MSIENNLNIDLKWREDELALLKKEIVIAKNDVKQKTLIRAYILLLYAHYEGYVKFAWDSLFDEIERSGVSRSQLSDSLRVFALEDKYKEIKRTYDNRSIWNFIENEYSQFIQERLNRFPKKLDTESNLWPNLYIDNCTIANIDVKEMQRERLIINKLVGLRNDIAHGQPLQIKNAEDCNEIENAVKNVLYEIALSVIDIVQNRKYLKNIA